MTAARADVLICGASFAGLAVARELAGAGADVLVVDRYELGERQTSACAAPTPWLHAMGVRDAIRQELPCMSFHTPHGSARFRLPWSWSSFDYRTLCHELWEQCDARFEVAHVTSREAAPKAGTRRTAGAGAARADSVAEPAKPRSSSRRTAARSPPRWSSTRSAGAASSGRGRTCSRPRR